MEMLTANDVQSRDAYEAERPDFRRHIMLLKDKRRIQLGPNATVLFECRDTMRYQVHEMLRVENSWQRPGAVDDELEAYNPLIPNRGELSATLMLEYETPEERQRILPGFVGIDRHFWLQVGDTEPLLGEFDRGQIDEHKVSSVQYVKWKLDERRRKLLKQEGTVLRLVIDHPAYKTQSVLSEETRRVIMNDPD